MLFTESLTAEFTGALKDRANCNDVTAVLSGVAEASIEIWQQLALVRSGVWSDTDKINHFGETTKDVDLLARELITRHVQENYKNTAVVTEEDVEAEYPKGGYALFVDPIDGSKHVQYQAECGSFFSLFSLQDNQLQAIPLASGYALYGYQLNFIAAIGQQLVVSAFDPVANDFVTQSRDYTMPTKGAHYSINDADIDGFPDYPRSFIEDLRAEYYKSRYNGVLVADLHRIVMEGGIFISPRLSSGKTKTKKYFEALAISHIMRNADGKALYNYGVAADALEKGQEDELFSSVPLVFGSKQEVEAYKEKEE